MRSSFNHILPEGKSAAWLAAHVLFILCACSDGPAESFEGGREVRSATQGLEASPLRPLPSEGWGVISGSVQAFGADPGGFLVLWTAGGYAYYATRLDVHGVPTGDPKPFVPAFSLPGVLVWAGSHYVLLSDGMVSTRLTEDGRLLDGEGSQILAGAGDSMRAACSGDDCLITFLAEDLRAVRFASDNTRTLPFQLASSVLDHDVVQAGDQRLAVVSSSTGVSSILLDETGEAKRSLLSTAVMSDVAVARLGEGFVVAARDDHPSGDTSIFVLDGSGGLVSEGQVALPTAIETVYETKILALCGGGDHAALVIAARVAGDLQTPAFVQQLDAAGSPLGPTTELGDLGPEPYFQWVACGTDTILALAQVEGAWIEARTLEGQKELVSLGSRIQPRRPAMAHGSTGTLMAWLDNKAETWSGQNTVLARLLDDSGAPISEEIFLANASTGLTVLAAFDGEVFLVAWWDNTHVLAVRLDPNGQVLDPTPLVLFETTGLSVPLSLASLPAGGFLMAAARLTGAYPNIQSTVEVMTLARSGSVSTTPHTIEGYENVAMASTPAGVYLVSLDRLSPQTPSNTEYAIASLTFDASGQPTASQPTKLGDVFATYYYPLTVVARGDEVVINHSGSKVVTVGPAGVSRQETVPVTPLGSLFAANDVGVRFTNTALGAGAGSQLLSCKDQGGREVRVKGSFEPAALVATGPSTWLYAVGNGRDPLLLTAIDDEGAALPCTDTVELTFAPSPEQPDGSVSDGGDGGDAGGESLPEFFDIGIATERIAGGEHGYLLAGCSNSQLFSAAAPLRASTTPLAPAAPTQQPAEACESVVDLLWTGEDYLALFLRAETLFGVRLDESGHNLSAAFKIADGFGTWTDWRVPGRVSAASNGEQVLVAFRTGTDGLEYTSGVSAVRVDLATQRVIDSSPLRIDGLPNTEPDPGLVAVATDGSGFVVAHTLPGASIFVRTVSAFGSVSEKRPAPVVQPAKVYALRLSPLGSRYVLSWRYGDDPDFKDTWQAESVVLDQDLELVDLTPQILDGWVAAGDEAHGAVFVQASAYSRLSPELGPLVFAGMSAGRGAVTGAAQSSAGYLVYSNEYGDATVLQRIDFDPAPLGTPCRFDGSCSSTFCVDGVCCDEACGDGAQGDCQACSQRRGAASDGTCSALTVGAAPLHVCRPAAGACDAPDLCVAGQKACPLDLRLGSDTICRASRGPCDRVDRCDGSAIACVDALQPAGWACGDRAFQGVCDLPDVCDGSSIACPDRTSEPGTVCRPAVNACDLPETCKGGHDCGEDRHRATPKCSGEPSGAMADAGGAVMMPSTDGGAPQGDDAGSGREPDAGGDVGACSVTAKRSGPNLLWLLAPWLLLVRRQRRSNRFV